MYLYRTTKHENAYRIVLPMRRYRVIDSDRKGTQDRGVSSHKEGIAEYAPTCAFMSCFFLNFDILQKHFEL